METEFDIQRWQKTVDDSSFTLGGIARLYDVAYKNLSNWFYHGVIPHKKSIEKMEIIMTDLKKRGGRIPYHPSYGYATTEQIEKLKKSITPTERSIIMKQIERQTKTGGKLD